MYEGQTKDCAGSWTFQHKSWYLSLLFWCLASFRTTHMNEWNSTTDHFNENYHTILLISVRIAFTTAKYRHNCLFFTSFTEANGCLLYLLQTLLVMDPLSDQSVHISTLKGFKVSGNRIFFFLLPLKTRVKLRNFLGGTTFKTEKFAVTVYIVSKVRLS